MREQLERAIAGLQELLANTDALGKVSKQLTDTKAKLADATARLEAVNERLADAEEESGLLWKARADAVRAHEAEISVKQREIRDLTAQVASLKAEWGERAELGVTGALAEARARHGEVVTSLDVLRKKLA
jgi:septal ring factor EnvC (AmiA/AmiB activator)